MILIKYIPIIAVVWIASVIGTLIMKKIQPDSYKGYIAYVFIVCVIYTAMIICWAYN